MSLFGSKKTTTVNTTLEPARTVSFVKDVTGAPAVSFEKVSSQGGVDLTKKFQKAGVSLSKQDLSGVRAQAVLVLDHSASMDQDYANGNVQQIVERALGFALNIDADGKIPVIPFDSRVRKTVVVSLGNYAGVVNNRIWDRHGMGTTNLTDALQVVLDMAKKTDEPLFCIVVTDGAPIDRHSAKRIVCQLASYPVFIKFLAIRPVDFLQDLDDLPDTERLIDNVDAKFLSDPFGMTDLAFAEAMSDEWASWIDLAKRAGLLR
jgi:hypothetical protein